MDLIFFFIILFLIIISLAFPGDPVRFIAVRPPSSSDPHPAKFIAKQVIADQDTVDHVCKVMLQETI